MNQRSIFCVFALLACLRATQGVGGEIKYRIIDLGALPDSRPEVGPGDINSSSQVTGGAVNGFYLEPFVWELSCGMRGLGDLPGGGTEGRAEAINANGHVAGYSAAESGYMAFLWTPEAGMIPLGDLAGGSIWSWARGINDLDEVTGHSVAEDTHEAFLWTTAGGMISLEEHGNGPFTHITVAKDINNATQVVGWGETPRYLQAAFVWDPDNGARVLGHSPDGSLANSAEGINERGQVVGIAGSQAFLWDPQEGFTSLGVLPGQVPVTIAYDVNNHEVVVGRARRGSGPPYEGFIWDRTHGMRSLNDLIAPGHPPEHSWLRFATAINDAGQIVGSTSWGRGVLLDPFVVADMNCDGSLNTFDVQGFLLVMQWLAGDDAARAEYQEHYPGCHGDWAADANQDGSVNQFDIQPFVELLSGG